MSKVENRLKQVVELTFDEHDNPRVNQYTPSRATAYLIIDTIKLVERAVSRRDWIEVKSLEYLCSQIISANLHDK